MKIAYIVSGIGLIVNMIMHFTVKDHITTFPMAIVAVGFIAEFIYTLIKD